MKNKKIVGRTAKIACSIFIVILVTVSFLAYYSAVWCKDKYGDVGFDAILFTLFSDMGGVAAELVQNYLKSTLVPALLLSAIILFILLFDIKGSAIFITFRSKLKLRLYPFKKRVSVIVSVVFYLLNYFLGFGFMSAHVNVVSIAVIHTLFNIVSTV